jgi:hypothetical protein
MIWDTVNNRVFFCVEHKHHPSTNVGYVQLEGTRGGVSFL